MLIEQTNVAICPPVVIVCKFVNIIAEKRATHDERKCKKKKLKHKRFVGGACECVKIICIQQWEPNEIDS